MRWSVVFAVLLIAPCFGLGGTIVVDFESFADGDVLTGQIAGLNFVNTVIYTSGVSLNEFDFPPHSGSNVASDLGGPITVDFSTPMLSFGAYFTYVEPLTISAFDAAHMLVGSITSAFTNNTGTGGDPGSSPNEFISITTSGIASVLIAGDPGGGSFAMDDLTFRSSTAVPEPDCFRLVLAGSVLTALVLLRRGRATPQP